MAFEGLAGADRRGAHCVVDEPDRLCAGFRSERHGQLQADLGLGRQQRAASLDLCLPIMPSERSTDGDRRAK